MRLPLISPVGLAFALVCLGSHAQTRFIPRPHQVVLPVSVQAMGSGQTAYREAERDWRAQPQDMNAAVRYARVAFQMGMNEGDLRWYGSAKAALMPWWQAPSLSADGHFVRGLVRQGFHDFEGGLADVNAAIALDDRRAAFWSWRFVLHLLASDVAAARQDCAEMRRRFGAGEGEACAAVLLYRTGQAAEAAALLTRTLKRDEFQDSGSQDWLSFHLGEAWRVAGQPERAIGVWEQRLGQDPGAHGIRLALVELLNAQKRHAEAKRWAAGPNPQATPSDALLVQGLLARQGLGDADTAEWAARVDERMATQRARGEDLIERPRMVYLIRYGKDPAVGLELARANWATQNEPPDAVLLLEAALQRNAPEAAQPVLDWMATTGYTEPALATLAQQVNAALKRR